jgi:hypothetical protein
MDMTHAAKITSRVLKNKLTAKDLKVIEQAIKELVAR